MPNNNSRSSGRSYPKPSYPKPSYPTPSYPKPSYSKPSYPTPVYRPQTTQPSMSSDSSKPTFGQSIKQGIGAGIGWSIGTGIFNTIFGTNKPQVIHTQTETKVVEKITTCENLREMLAKSFKYEERIELEKKIKENCTN